MIPEFWHSVRKLLSRSSLPQSLTGKAITYTLGQWDKLLVFLQDGRVRIDNNLVENTIRPSAIGKKNWLFMGDPKSGGRAALFYTLIGNCHRAGIVSVNRGPLTRGARRDALEITTNKHRLG